MIGPSEWRDQAMLRLRDGDYAGAVELLLRVVHEPQPGDFNTAEDFASLGAAYGQLKQFDLAEVWLARAVERAESDQLPMLSLMRADLGSILLAQDKYHKVTLLAAGWLEQEEGSGRSEPFVMIMYLELLARAHGKLGDCEELRIYTLRAVELGKDRVRMSRLLAEDGIDSGFLSD